MFGEFARFAGQYFSNWDERAHVLELSEVTFQPWWPRWISVDWGFQHHAVVYWHAQAGTIEKNGEARPLTVRYREYVRSHLSERALAEEIVANNNGEQIDNIYAGHDLWDVDRPGPTKEQAMSEVFVRSGLPSMKKANIDRVNGWRFMHLALDESLWLITRNCKNALAAMPTAIFDEKKNNEDILKTNDLLDDVRDSLRYGLYSRYAPVDVPFEQRLRQETAHLADPQSRAMHLMKVIADHEQGLKNSGFSNLRCTWRQRFRK